MAIWMIRAGAHGEYEQKFLQESRFYATSDGLATNLALLKDREALITALKALHPEDKPKTILNWASQLWPFAKEIKKGDLIVFPLKAQRAINIGEVTFSL